MIKNFTRLFIHFSFVAIAGLFLNDLTAQCVTSSYTMVPPPTAGAYQPGQVVEICGSITFYQQTGANWIHGIIPTFPAGWVQTSFTNVSSPATCSGSGVWLWMPNGVPGASCTAGWYFDSPIGGPFDGNPGNNWGDPCSVFNWEFCMTATVGTPEGGGAIGCGGTGNPLDGESILPIFTVTGDGECGSWGGACSCCSVPSVPPGPIQIDCCDAEAGVSPGTLLICETGSFNLIDELLPPYTTGTWQGPAGYTGNGSANGPFNPANLAINPPGDYIFTVIGTDGCESTSTITMELNDLGIVQYPGYCNGVDVALITLSTNVTLPPGGTWYFPNGTVVPGGILSPVTNNHPAGIYTYEFYNSGNCLTTASLDITLGTGGGGTACNTVIDVCSTDASFFLLDVMSCTLNPGGAWIHELLGPPILFYNFYFTSTVLIDPSTLPASSLFSYAVGVPGCNLQIITLTVNLFDPVDVGDFTQASICVSEAPVVLETLLDGTPDPGLTWTDLGTNLVIPNLFDPSSYAPNTTLTLTYSGGLAGTTCAATQLLELTILPDNVDAGNNNSIIVCSSDPPFLMTPELGGTPNAGGLWESSSGITFPSGQFAPGTNPSGTYSYTVSSSCGSDVAYLVITVVNILSPGTNGTLDICSGENNVPLINGLGGAPYTPGTWSGPTPGATVNGSGVSDGDVYTYTVGSGSCAASATVTINLEATPFAGTAVTPPPIYCASDPSLPLATFLNPGPSSAGTWTGPGTFTGSTLNPSIHVTGNYTHTVTSANCGSDTETIFITIEPVPNAGNSTIVNACPNGIPLNLFAALGGGVSTPGIWTAPAGGPTNGTFTPANGNPAGVYTYTVASPSGLCVDFATVTVNYSTLPNPGINGSIAVCASNPPFSLISVLGGTPQTTGGTWFNPSFSIVPGGSNAQFNPASSAPGNYIYSLTGAGCPPVSSTVSISIVPLPIAGTNTTVTRCEIEGLIDLFPLLNGSPNSGGTWTLAGGVVNPPFDITGQGGTSLVFIYTVGSGTCTSSANLTVTVTPAVNAGPDVVVPDLCAGGTLNLLTWLDPSAGTGSFSPSNTVPQVPASNGTYIYNVDGGSCPDDNATYTISIDPPLIATAGVSTCNAAQTNYTVSFTISGGDGTYFVNGISSGPTFTSAAQPLGPIYSFVVSDGGPCSNVTVSGPSPNCNCPAAASFTGGNQSVCAGESVALELNLNPVVSGPFTVVYSIGGAAQPPITGLIDGDIITVNPATTTTYALVSVEDQNCVGTASGSITVTVETPPNAGPNVVVPDLCAGGTLNLLTLLDPSAGAGSFTPSNTVPQTPASSGTYTYTVNGVSCPDDIATYSISIDPILNATPGVATCNGAQTSYTVTFTISGGDGTYFVNGISSGPTFTSAAQPLGPIYSFVVSDAGPCGNVTVTGPSPNCNCPATASFTGGSQSICAGESVDLELNLNPVVSGPFTVVYSIGGVAQTPLTGLVDGDVITVNPVTTTTYAIVSVEDQNCIGNASGSITVTVETPPNAGPDVTTDLCATGGTLNLLNILNPAAGPGVFAPSNTVPQIPASSGAYTYTSPGNACPNDQAIYTINIDPVITATSSAVCNTAQTGYIVTFTPSGGDGTYTITGNPGSLAGGVFTSVLIPTGNSYSFTIADGGLCADLTLTGGSPQCDCTAEGSMSGSTTICSGNSATLTFSLQGNGPFSVTYSNSSVPGNVVLTGIFNGHTINVNPSATSTYTIQSISDANCVGTTSGSPVTVTVNSPVTSTNIQETCNNIGESYQVSFNVSGGSGSYNILPAGGQLTAGVYTSAPIPTGQTYNFTVNDTGPCPAITVTGSETCPCTSDVGTLNSGALEACANENIQVPATSNAVLDGNDLLQYVMHDGSATELGTIYETSNTGIFSFQGTMTLGVTYYIAAVVGNANGFGIVNLNHPCTDVSDGVPVIFDALPSAAITGGAQVCPGEPVDFNISFTGEAPWDFSYAVDGSDPVNAFTSSPNYTITSTQPGTYTLGEVSDNNCVAMGTGSASLLNFTPPTAVLSGDPNICENSGDGPLVSLTGQAPWTFVYSIGGVDQPPVTSNFPNYTIPAEVDGTYALVSVEGPNCIGTATGSLAVTLLESPSAQITGGGAVCAGEVANFNVNLTGNGPWVVQYAVDGVPQQPLNITQPFFTFQSGIDGDYVISQVSDQNCIGEVISSAAALNVTPLPTGEITADNNILCFGQEVQLAFNLQGVGPFDIVYVINGDTISVNGVPSTYVQSLTPLEPVVAELLYIQDGSLNGCTSEPNISTFIQVSELPNAPVLTDQTVCADTGAFAIGTFAAPGLSYSWSPETGLSDPKIANPELTLNYAGLSARTYEYIVTASNGECTAQDTAFITVEPGPQAYFTFSPDKISSEDPTVYFNNMTFGAPGLQYYWTFDSLDFSNARSPSYKFPDGITANYAVTLMATDTSTGCSGMYEREISIRPELLVYIPSAFTPDGDGLNDLWGPVMQNIDRNTYRLTVFDRYGEIVFETRDADQKWRGDLMGSEYYVQTGVYVWLIETKNKTSLEEFELKGIVTVVR